MGFDNLSPSITDSDHLLQVFEAHRAALLEQMGRRLILALAALVAGLFLPGAWGLAALCLTLPATLGCMITLHHVIRPREPVLRFDVDPAPCREDPPPGG